MRSFVSLVPLVVNRSVSSGHPRNPTPLISIGCDRIQIATVVNVIVTIAHGAVGSAGPLRVVPLGDPIRQRERSHRPEQDESHLNREDRSRAACPVHRHSGSPSTGRPNRSIDHVLGDRDHREETGQQMESVVRQPHAEAERHERVGVAHGDPAHRSAGSAGNRAGERRGAADEDQRRDARATATNRIASTGTSEAHAEERAPATPRGGRPARPCRTRSAGRRRRTARPAPRCPAAAPASRRPIAGADRPARPRQTRPPARCCRADTRARSRGRTCSPGCRPSTAGRDPSSHPRWTGLCTLRTHRASCRSPVRAS